MKNLKDIDQIMVPARMTGYFQTLDIAINKPLKHHMRKEITEFIENTIVRNHPRNFLRQGL